MGDGREMRIGHKKTTTNIILGKLGPILFGIIFLKFSNYFTGLQRFFCSLGLNSYRHGFKNLNRWDVLECTMLCDGVRRLWMNQKSIEGGLCTAGIVVEITLDKANVNLIGGLHPHNG
jgi:hypothetical protein